MSDWPVRATQRRPRVLVIGAGIGGLSAAALLARQGLDVELLERSQQPGGKMRQLAQGPHRYDGGPTVLTMRWVFDALFEQLGRPLDGQLGLRRCAVLARHAWGANERLDLLADLDHSVAAIADFSGAAEAQRYRLFCQRSSEIYQTLRQPFLCAQRPSPLSLTWRIARQQGWPGLRQMARISPFDTLWKALGGYFEDPRLRQLFGRYATYCGSSPLTAPATLMLVAHVEREAVWQIDGGMHGMAQAIAAAGCDHGLSIRYGQHVREILVSQGRVSGVALDSGERIAADVVVFNGDAAALSDGLLGQPIQRALGLRSVAPERRSLSAITWHGAAEVEGFDLSHHNVFFCDPAGQGYVHEFEALARGRLAEAPSVYLCAQDRRADVAPAGAVQPPTAVSDRTTRPAGQPERVMMIVNAPATGDHRPVGAEELQRCQDQMLAQMARAGLQLKLGPEGLLQTTPQDFDRLFPATGGALYGRASQGWRATFARPGSSTRVPGLFLAGGSVHPGPGAPMASLSGQLAAEQICADLRSTRRWMPAPTPGGISMR